MYRVLIQSMSAPKMFSCEDTKTFDVPVNRLEPHHILLITEYTYKLTHPLGCGDFPNCEYDRLAESWSRAPTEPGEYEWGGDPIEMSFKRIDGDG